VRLHRQYGPGLKNIYNPMTKEFNVEEFTATNKKLKDTQYKLKSINLPGANTDNGIVSIGGVKIDTTKSTAFILGWVAGMQY
jgi:hypothetical protein